MALQTNLLAMMDLLLLGKARIIQVTVMILKSMIMVKLQLEDQLLKKMVITTRVSGV